MWRGSLTQDKQVDVVFLRQVASTHFILFFLWKDEAYGTHHDTHDDGWNQSQRCVSEAYRLACVFWRPPLLSRISEKRTCCKSFFSTSSEQLWAFFPWLTFWRTDLMPLLVSQILRKILLRLTRGVVNEAGMPFEFICDDGSLPSSLVFPSTILFGADYNHKVSKKKKKQWQ